MLKSEVQKALNKQVKIESESSQYYLFLASWAENEGYPGTAAFLYKHADEERFHMLKLIKYINERGGNAVIPALEQPNDEIEGLTYVFKSLLEHEIKVTENIEEVVDLTLEKKDYVTHNFMQWYVAEQLEEEDLARTLNDKLKLIGQDKGGLYLFDRDLESLETHE